MQSDQTMASVASLCAGSSRPGSRQVQPSLVAIACPTRVHRSASSLQLGLTKGVRGRDTAGVLAPACEGWTVVHRADSSRLRVGFVCRRSHDGALGGHGSVADSRPVQRSGIKTRRRRLANCFHGRASDVQPNSSKKRGRNRIRNRPQEATKACYSSSIWLYMRLSWIS